MNKRYNSLNDWLKHRFGKRVYKVGIESGLTCPNRDGKHGRDGCIFCSTDSFRPWSALGEPASSIRAQVEEGIRYLRRRHGAGKVISHFANGTNTYTSAEVLEFMLNEAIEHEDVVGLAVSTRPDCMPDDHLRILKKFSDQMLLWVELGLQSSHDKTLELINRGHTVEQFMQACRRLQKLGIFTCAHVILGLPGETHTMMMETARFINRIGIWGVKIHNLHVLSETELERMFLRGEVTVATLEEYASCVADFLEELSPSIVIHRFNSHSPRRFTVAPEWSINKLGVFNAVEAELERRDTWQGKKYRDSSFVVRGS